jgi:hypothetical protein
MEETRSQRALASLHALAAAEERLPLPDAFVPRTQYDQVLDALWIAAGMVGPGREDELIRSWTEQASLLRETGSRLLPDRSADSRRLAGGQGVAAPRGLPPHPLTRRED